MTRLEGMAPVASPKARLLVLGSFPGGKSLELQQYYAHPQNHFWKILSALWNADLMNITYARRCAELKARGLAVWDVYGACEREGSLDTSIRNAQVNDFAALARNCPRLQAVAHNGGESFKHARHLAALGLPVYRLPSTSPANASWSFERKLTAWREVFTAHGLA